jgi:hypothetical protein
MGHGIGVRPRVEALVNDLLERIAARREPGRGLSLAVPAAELTPLRSFLTNDHARLPVRLSRRGDASVGSAGAP